MEGFTVSKKLQINTYILAAFFGVVTNKAIAQGPLTVLPTEISVNMLNDTYVDNYGCYSGIPITGNASCPVNTTDLRGALNYINANAGDYNIGFSNAGTINLNAMLPIVNLAAANAISIDGNFNSSNVVIDGGNRVLSHLQFECR